ncbi:MAG: alpha/beta fold hydrolase [Nitriliruptor sp.]|nr:MAG: alpha/beta fold hydrolase [Nitriliruptor sp.]
MNQPPAAGDHAPRERVRRTLDWTLPPSPVTREVIEVVPDHPVANRPPLLFVHGAWHGAWCWQERWLPAAAAAGWHSVAVSLRGHGGSGRPERFGLASLRHYEHDVLQTITTLPSPPVLIGHSLGGVVVQGVLERYRSAPAGVLVASMPPVHGLQAVPGLLRHDPGLLVQALVGREVTPRSGTLFGPATDPGEAAEYLARLGPESWLATQQVVLPRRRRDIRAPVLVLGGEHDVVVPPHAVVRTARHFGTRAHLFRGMGHELMLEPGWDAVLRRVLGWLETTLTGDAGT